MPFKFFLNLGTVIVIQMTPNAAHAAAADYIRVSAVEIELIDPNANLKAKIAGYRKALIENPRERDPLKWAEIQSDLGNALTSLSERGGGTTYLKEAIAAFREALKERTRERVPTDWAITQNNLGNTFASLGRLESGTARLEEAVSVLREALKEITRECGLRNWATLQNSLGRILSILGERQNNIARLQEAVTAFRAGIDIAEKANATHQVEYGEKNLVHTESLIAKLSERSSK